MKSIGGGDDERMLTMGKGERRVRGVKCEALGE